MIAAYEKRWNGGLQGSRIIEMEILHFFILVWNGHAREVIFVPNGLEESNNFADSLENRRI